MCRCLSKWHLAAGFPCGLRCEDIEALSQPLVHSLLCCTHHKARMPRNKAKEVTFTRGIFQHMLISRKKPYDHAVWAVFRFVCNAFVLWGTFESWKSSDSSSSSPDIIFTSVTQHRLLLPCLTFWCGTNSQQPTSSLSSANDVCFCICISLSPVASCLSRLLLL